PYLSDFPRSINNVFRAIGWGTRSPCAGTGRSLEGVRMKSGPFRAFSHPRSDRPGAERLRELTALGKAAMKASGQSRGCGTLIKYHLVGTYHKAGTIWMRGVFYNLCKEVGLPFIKKFDESASSSDQDRVCGFNDHSLFPKDFLYREDVRILHVIRDPRNMLLSGMHYHERCPPDRERWLHQPRPGLNGRSYQQHLRSLSGINEKLKFEMQNSHRANMRLMREWDYENPSSIEVRYEQLMDDIEGVFFTDVLRRLGLTKAEADIGRTIFLAKHVRRAGRDNTGHVRERETDWRDELPRETAALYAEWYGQDLINLGYESDHTWVNRL